MSIKGKAAKANSVDIRSILGFPIIYWLFGRLIGSGKSGAMLLDYLRPKAGDKILDIGCGPADILEYLPEVEYIGLDIDQNYIDAAQKKFGGRARFICAGIRGGAVTETSAFDIVLAKGVLHHLDDDEAVEMFRLAQKALKPSGRLITMDGCRVEGRLQLEYYLLANDRGRYVRTREESYALAAKVFPNVRTNIHHDLLRIPYTHLIMECSL